LFLPIQPAQILIKAAAQLFEGYFGNILAREILLLKDRRKNSYVGMAGAYSHIQGVEYGLMAVCLRMSVPSVAPGSHRRAVKFHGMWEVRGESRSDPV
jgi:hypothetical protein